ncbi:hypothetical protein [Streptomyces sp. NPDC003710]
MNFILTGHDALSRVFDRVGDSAQRLHRRLDDVSTRAGAGINRFTTDTGNRLSRLQRDSKAGEKALKELKTTALLLAPAAIPAAASLAPIAAGALTVGAAMAAMGAALGPQISALGDASKAQEKYDQAVQKNGEHSQQAIEAQSQLAQTVAKIPPATREAAAAVGVLKDNYQKWSDSLAGDTMAPFIKGVEITNALLPKTSGLVKAASSEADRFMTIVGGEIASPGLDHLNTKFTGFAQKTLRSVNDEIVHLLRVSEGKNVGGPAKEFMDWARAQGPTVASVLKSVATALVHVLQAGSDVGVGLLQVIDVLAKLVSAVPPSAISTFLQLAFVLKATKTAALGLAAGRTVLAQFGAQIVAMQTAAGAAPGRLRAITAAIGAMSRSAKVAVAGTGLGLLIVALTELSQRGKQAPPDVDKLTSSLKELGATGRVTGEASKAFGKDLDGLYGKVRSLTDPSTTDKVQQFLIGWTGWDSTPVKDAKENIGAVDKALANLVQSGQSDLAAAALKRLTAEYGKGGRDTGEFTKHLGDYKQALADAKFEAQLAADAQGIFGMQAMSVQQKLAAQKLSADGLRQSIQALSETSRGAFDAQTKFEAAIDNVTKSLKDNGRTLDVGTEKGRANRDALSQMASATEDAAAKARENGASWETVAGIYDKGRKTLVDNITAITGNRKEAERLAATLLHMPSPQMRLEMRTEDAVRSLDGVIAAMKRTPNAKKVTVSALTSDAVSLLRDLGFKVTHMKDGRFQITAETANAKSNIAAVQRARDALKSKSIDLAARDRASATASAIARAIAAVRGKTVTINTVWHTLGVEGTAGRNNAKLNGYAGGGRPRPGEVAWVGENGPELMSFDGTERILDHAASMKAIRPSTEAAGALAGAGLAVGMAGATAGVGAAARAMAAQVEVGIRDELQIASPSKKTKALAHDVARGFLEGLTGSRAKIKSASVDLVKDIKTAFSGRKESSLIRMVDRQTKRLMDLAAKRDKIAARIAEAKQFASDVTRNAREQAGLSNLGMSPEEVTAGGIKAGLAGKLAQIKQFTRYIDILAKKGLNKGLLRQILNMGPEAGYAYASALVGADKNTFKSISSLQSQLDKSTTTLGQVGADRLYDAGRNASKGFLKGLQGQEKDIERLMMSIAKSMQKALKRALGIRSPSRVMAEIGAYSTQGLAHGLVGALPHVDRALAMVSGRVAGTQPILGRPAMAAAGGVVYNIQVDVHEAMDPVAVGREFQRVLLQFGRVQGATVSLKVGG